MVVVIGGGGRHFTKKDSDNTIKSTMGDLGRIFQEHWAYHIVPDVKEDWEREKLVVNICINRQFLRSRCGPCDFYGVSIIFFLSPTEIQKQ